MDHNPNIYADPSKSWGFPAGAMVLAVPGIQNMSVSEGYTRDMGSIPGSGRSPVGGHGSQLQYSCLGNPMDRAAWRATVHSIAKNLTGLK